MAKRDKRIEALRRNPRTVRPDDLDIVLRQEGFVMARQRGSHKRYDRGTVQLTVPQRHPYLLEVYLHHALALIDDGKEKAED